MPTRNVLLVVAALTLVLVGLITIAFGGRAKAPALAVSFLYYTNSPQGQLAAKLEIRNNGNERVARNSCRITPEPSDAGYWYAADVPPRRLEPNQREEILVTFQPGPMTRWRATAVYVRNPTDWEYRFRQCLDWLQERGVPLSPLRKWCDSRTTGQASCGWVNAPKTKSDS